MNLKRDKLVQNWLKNMAPIPKINTLNLNQGQDGRQNGGQNVKSEYPSAELRLKKILFLEPHGVEANVFSFAMRYPLLGPLRMTTILREHGYNAILYNENIARKDVPEYFLKNADILIITLLTMTSPRGYNLARRYKELKSDGKVIMGGIHVSFNVDEALPYADQVVVGEGDEIILDLVEGKFKEKVVYAERIKNLTKLPIPELKCVVNSKRIKIAPILTSLGCPFNCSFCLVTAMYGRGYRRFSIEQTLEAIERYKKKKVFFLDDNFCADKKRNLQLFRLMKEKGIKIKWIAQVRADLAKDEEFVKEMALAGCRRVFIGFESINQGSLDQVVKNTNIETYIKATEVFHKYGIAIHGMFILGLDSDRKDTFKNTLKFCKKYGIETSQFLMITPFTGTRFYDELHKSRLITNDKSLYDGNHVIIRPKYMTSSELFEGMLKLYTKYYSWISIFKQVWRDIKTFYQQKIRSFGYRLNKLLNNFFRNIGFRLIIRRLKFISRKYRKELKQLSEHERELISNDPQLITFKEEEITN